MLPGTKYGFYTLGDTICYSQDFSTWDNVSIGDQIDYEVQIRPCGSIGEQFNTSFRPYETIYYGRLTVIGGNQIIILNDIVVSHMYDHKYISPRQPLPTRTHIYQEENIDNSPVELGTPTEAEKFFIDINILFRKHNKNYEIFGVIQFYPNKDHILPTIIPLSYDETVAGGVSNGIFYWNRRNGDSEGLPIYNVLNLSTQVIPRIPILKKADNFWLGMMLIEQTVYDGLFPKTFDITDYSDTVKYSMVVNNPVFTYNIGGEDYVKMLEGVQKYLAIRSPARWTKIANIDECPADYYLIWMDRTGAYQCQPFNKKVTLQEDITKTNIVDSLDNSRPANVSVTSKWTLNSDWLSKEEYQAYESIFVSPYLYLYYPADDRGWWVNCDSKTWTSKTKFDKKLRNLSVTVSSIAPQNIIY